MSGGPLLARGAVARLLGLTTPRFLRLRGRLEAEQGFPPPVPGLALRWDPRAIEDWLAARRAAPAAAASESSPALDAWEATLAARADTLPLR